MRIFSFVSQKTIIYATLRKLWLTNKRERCPATKLRITSFLFGNIGKKYRCCQGRCGAKRKECKAAGTKLAAVCLSSPNLHKQRFNEKDLRNLRSCKYFCVLLLLLSRSRATVCPDARQQNDMQHYSLAHHGFVICKLTLFITMDDYHAENNV